MRRLTSLPVSGAQRWAVPATVESVILAASVFWALSANSAFLSAALRDRHLTEPRTWGFACALLLMLVALHFVLLGVLCNRWTTKPVLAALLVATAAASHFTQSLGVQLDPSMVRGLLRADGAQARELGSWRLLAQVLVYGLLPLLMLRHVHLEHRPWRRATAVRVACLLVSAAVFAGTLFMVAEPFNALMRQRKEVRYLATPANLLWSAAAVASAGVLEASHPRRPIGLDAGPGPRLSARKRPLLVVLVVGESARAANWGLNGYTRQTTPELARLPVVNFAHVTACGTHPEVSLPCMFAPTGRRSDDQARVRGSQSLLHVLARAGVSVHWLDNQYGCKGVCEGLSNEDVVSLNPPGLCRDGRCWDEGLLSGLDKRLARLEGSAGTSLLVLHQLGNQGPAYFRRYPAGFARYGPACQQDDLRRCSAEQIVNAYDNALLYTDHVLASLIAKLAAHAGGLDSAMLYLSDHGESLGEGNQYLHGLPYATAPEVQKQVPMVAWFSAGAARELGLDLACLRRRATAPVTHDHLFHTLLGWLDVNTAIHDPAWDLSRDCPSPVQPLVLKP